MLCAARAHSCVTHATGQQHLREVKRSPQAIGDPPVGFCGGLQPKQCRYYPRASSALPTAALVFAITATTTLATTFPTTALAASLATALAATLTLAAATATASTSRATAVAAATEHSAHPNVVARGVRQRLPRSDLPEVA